MQENVSLCVTDLVLASHLQRDRENDPDEEQHDDNADYIFAKIDDAASVTFYEELMILIKDSVKDRKPEREYDVHLVIGF